jgi:hypothetical protein
MTNQIQSEILRFRKVIENYKNTLNVFCKKYNMVFYVHNLPHNDDYEYYFSHPNCFNPIDSTDIFSLKNDLNFIHNKVIQEDSYCYIREFVIDMPEEFLTEFIAIYDSLETWVTDQTKFWELMYQV